MIYLPLPNAAEIQKNFVLIPSSKFTGDEMEFCFFGYRYPGTPRGMAQLSMNHLEKVLWWDDFYPYSLAIGSGNREALNRVRVKGLATLAHTETILWIDKMGKIDGNYRVHHYATSQERKNHLIGMGLSDALTYNCVSFEEYLATSVAHAENMGFRFAQQNPVALDLPVERWKHVLTDRF